MTNKSYSVVIPRNPNGDFSIKNFNTLKDAQCAAQENRGEIWEYENSRLKNEEDHKIRGKLIEDHKSFHKVK